MKRNQRNAQLQVIKELVGVFEEAQERGNYALANDIINDFAYGDFKAPDENGRDYSLGFDEFEPAQAARIIAYARHAMADFKRNPPAPDELSR